MGIIRGLIGIIVIFAIAYLLSYDRKSVPKKIKSIAIMFVIQLVITFLGLRTDIGLTVLQSVSGFFTWLLAQAAEGVNFVFGGIAIENGAFVFFLHTLMPITFISALIGILNYIGVLPFILKWVGRIVNLVTGAGSLESQISVTTTMFGSPASYIPVTDQIKKISKKRLFNLAVFSFSTVASSTLASYMSMIPGEFVVVAVFLNIFASFTVLAIVNPYDAEEDQKAYEAENGITAIDESAEGAQVKPERENFFDMLSGYISQGFNIAISIAAQLIGFVALIAFLNNGLEALIGISFTEVLGYIFAPIAYIIGIPSADIVSAGSIMATKLLTNEFVGIGELLKIWEVITPKTQAMVSVYLISFANLGSIGILTGAFKSIDEKQSKFVSGFVIKLMVTAILSSLLVSTIVGLFY